MGRTSVSNMLNELYIENFAIIDSLRITFSPGMNILSGETGAGKSIIVGAVTILLGDRASNDLIRSSAESAVVEAQFDIGGNEETQAKLKEFDLYDGEELVITRTISRSGKNRISVNGRLATAAMLSSISESLVNICGQHAHQALVQKENHIDILDEFAGLGEEQSEYALLYGDYQALLRKREDLKRAGRDRESRGELLRFQLAEIEASDVKTGEDQALADEKRVLVNAEKLQRNAEDSYSLLYESEVSLLGELDRVRTMIGEIIHLDPSFSMDEGTMDGLYYGLEEAAFTLRDYLGEINHDPRRLEEIDDRIELLGTLKRKYGGSIEAVLERKDQVARELEEMDHLEESLDGLNQDIDRRKAELDELADNLSKKRKEAARLLEGAVKSELADLRMANATFAVHFADEIPTLHGKGFDEIEFYLSANRGEAPKPLSRVASGGELSRIVLALKKVLVHGGSAETVVFDEVDSGIGGAVAQVVGSKLKDIALRHQVICITHLPQIASFATTHFQVTKGVADDRTSAGVRTLDDDERIEEIARMLGGVDLTEKTREHAREMVRLSQEDTRAPSQAKIHRK